MLQDLTAADSHAKFVVDGRVPHAVDAADGTRSDDTCPKDVPAFEAARKSTGTVFANITAALKPAKGVRA